MIYARGDKVHGTDAQCQEFAVGSRSCCVSEQARFVFGTQVIANDEYPMHQTDETVKVEVQHLLAWLGCALQHKKAGLLSS